tara:strand:+ start:17 stop:325 length:309 start_codon:yes stop_codon:yes gene_type:complete
MYKDDLVYEFNDDMWYLWHDGTIDNEDDFQTQLYQWLEDKVIHEYDCKKICDKLDYDIFEEHHVYGKAENWYQAAYNALFDLLSEHDETLTYDEIIAQHEEA